MGTVLVVGVLSILCLWNHQCRCVPSRMLSSPQLQSFQPLIFSTRPSTMSTMAIFARSSGFLGFVLALALGLTLGSSASATFTDCCMPTNWTAEHTATACGNLVLVKTLQTLMDTCTVTEPIGGSPLLTKCFLPTRKTTLAGLPTFE